MAGLLDDEEGFNKIITNPILQMGLGIMANATGPRGQGLGSMVGQGAMQGMQNVAQAQQMQANQQMRALQGMQIQQALQSAQRQREAIAQLPEEQRQAVLAGVPYSDIWKRQNPEAKYEKRYNPQTGQEEYGWVTPQDFRPVGGAKSNLPEGMIINDQGQRAFDPAYIKGKKEIAAAGRSSTNVFTGQKETFKNERDLRNDFAGLPTTKAFNEMQSAYDQINTGLKSANPAGDLAAATKFMKLLDPGSVVRESELAMAMGSTGLLDRAQNMAQMIIKGEKLTPKQRQEFGTLAQQLFDASANQYNKTAGEYQSIASDYGLNPERIAKPYQKPKVTEPMALPKDLKASNLVKGQTYKTPRGVAVWNGMAFEAQ